MKTGTLLMNQQKENKNSMNLPENGIIFEEQGIDMYQQLQDCVENHKVVFSVPLYLLSTSSLPEFI